jgi:excisionase family DNA binding protein
MSKDGVEPLLLRIPEAQAALAVGRSTIYQLIADGSLKAVHIGRAVRIRASEVRAWVERQADDESARETPG